MKVLRVWPRPRHGGFAYHGSITYTLRDGAMVRTVGIGRHFMCECGEPMLDGDEYDGQLYDDTRRVVHMRCREELVA